MRVLSTTLALLVTCSGTAPAMDPDPRPNVLVILTDDQGWGDLSCNGNKNLSTPNIDALSRSGANFDRFFVCPVCSPTRAEFLTGRYHPRGGVYSTSAGGERLDLDEVTIGNVFKASGYATGAFGKWHNGMQYPYHPNGRGFDEYYGFCSGHWGNYFSPMLERNGAIVRGEGFIIDDLTDKAMEFMEKNARKRKPFFAYVPYNTPHSPMQVPDRWWNKFKDHPLGMRHRDPKRENVPHTRAALAMCENIDWNVGRILKRLEELKIADNTIVVYFCDNGPNGFRWNGGMKGRKGSTDEGGVRSPLFIRWPGKIKAGTKIPQIAAAIDLLPTLADLTGIRAPQKNPLDGKSLKPLLFGTEKKWSDRIIFSHWRGRVSARTQQFRRDHLGKLFDMTKDPGQRTDVSDKHVSEKKRLAAEVLKWKSEMPSLKKDDRPFPVGHPEFEWTQLPARDAKTTGDIKRSNRFPNCSYFTNWTSGEERIYWDVEVLKEGLYSVELYYTCPKGSTGSTIELSVGEARISGKVTEPHDPPLLGKEQDRLPRQESYVKEFRPMKLGTIQMKRGRALLQLKATKVTGKQVMDFRLMMLRRIPSPK